MFLSCIRAAGWKCLSFSAVLHHNVNWLMGPTRVAKTEGRQPKECLSFLPCLSLCACKLCAFAPLSGQRQRPSRCTCMWECDTWACTHARAPSPSIWGQGDELWRLNVSLSQWCTCAPMCVPVWCGRNAVGSPESENRAPGCLVPALFVKMKFQMLLGVLSASLLQNKWR